MSPSVLATLAWLRPDDALKWALALIVALLVIGRPRELLRSLRRLLDSEDPKSRLRSPIQTMPVENLRARLSQIVQPTLLLIPTSEVGFSKLGGDPELSADLVWPPGYDRPRRFLAQIELAALPAGAIDWLPQTGRLYAFQDQDALDVHDAVRILFSRAPAGPAHSPPARVKPYLERHVAFETRTSAPSLDWLGLDAAELGLRDDEFVGLQSIGNAPTHDELQHRMGGYPNEIQPERMWLSCERAARGLPEAQWDDAIPPEIARAASQWRLLLQVDSDPGLRMEFGDGGRLYVFIREADARAPNFSKTVTLWQTY